MTSAVGQPPAAEAEERHAEPAEVGLALGADVEEPAVKGDGHREAREDEVRRVVERVADRLAVAEGAGREQPERPERVLADEQDDHRRERRAPGRG